MWSSNTDALKRTKLTSSMKGSPLPYHTQPRVLRMAPAHSLLEDNIHLTSARSD